MKQPVSLQSRDIQQLFGKLSKFFVIDAVLDTERLLLWSCHFATRSPLAAVTKTLSRANYKQTLRVFLTIVVYRGIVGSLVTSL
jgi:hypothetical protein